MLHSRGKRLEEALRECLSEIFLHGMKDPRKPAIMTITRVTMAKDSQNATIHFSQMPDKERDIDATMDMLEDSRGYIRTQVAKKLDLKTCPVMHFRFDPSEGDYQRINSLLNKVRTKEEPPQES